jgi:serine/threonine-protein kinase
MSVESFGPYQLQELIGRGGMGEVYRAYDTAKDRVVALKRLPAHLASDADFAARFRRESQVAARLREPHVVPIHDYGEIDGQLYIDMRLVEGADLAELIKNEGRLPPQRAVRIVEQVAGALDAAHADGLVHRDVKPSNVLVTGDDHVYLADFGIAHSVSSTTLTGTGAAVGTLDYMAPERFLSGKGDRRVDVYALGCLLYEALTGRKPFLGEGLAAQMYAHVHAPPPRPSLVQPGLPPALDEVIARALAKSPDDRFASAGALGTAARAALTSAPWGPRSAPAPASTQVGPPSVLVPASSGPGPWRRRAIVAMVVAALSLVAAGVAIGTAVTRGSGSTTAAGATTTSATSATATSAGQAAATTSTTPVGDAVEPGQPIRDGSIEVTVVSARTTDSVELGNDLQGYEPTPAGPGGQYVLVEARVLNDGDKSMTLGCGQPATAVFDDRNRRFDPLQDSYQLRGNKPLCVQPLQPGFASTFTWAYRVPSTATVTAFAAHDNTTDFRRADETSPRVRLDLASA